MQASNIEDCLEAILIIVSEEGHNPLSDEIRRRININEEELYAIISQLEAEGHIVREGEAIALTETGRASAEMVIRKHRTIECFLTEMLGMDAERASREACILEHDVSDETIDRLSSYIDAPCPRIEGKGRGRRKGNCTVGNAHATLLNFEEGAKVEVQMVCGLGRNRRLIDLGIVPGEQLCVRRRLRNRSIVVSVKGCDVALSPEIADSVFVERCI